MAIVAFPVLFAVYLSLTDYNLTLPTQHFVGLQQYRDSAQDTVFLRALVATIVLSTVALNLELLAGLAIAQLVVSQLRGRALWQTLLMVPLMFPPVLAGYQFKWIFNASVGVVNSLLYSLTGTPHPIAWLVDVPLGWTSILTAELWLGIPFVTIILIAGILSVPTESLEAAGLDGATGWQTFRHVTLPTIGPFIWMAMALRSLDIGRLYDIIRIMTGGGPAHRTETLWTYIGIQATSNGAFGYAAAMSVVISTVSVLFSFAIFANLFKARRVKE
jgi:multiple sugar transport system permease protein